MEELLQRLEIRYDVVFIDTPPASAVSDAIPLLTRVDGVLVVSRLNRTDRHALVRLATQLENLKARTLGVVVNGIVRRRGGYGYSYAYAYGDGASTQRPGQRSADAIARPAGSNGAEADREAATRARPESGREDARGPTASKAGLPRAKGCRC